MRGVETRNNMPIEFPLLNDTNNLLEIKAIEKQKPERKYEKFSDGDVFSGLPSPNPKSLKSQIWRAVFFGTAIKF